MGGKSSTSSSTVQIPPEVLARYNAVNARAEQAAANPFQNYNGQFVAGLTQEQQQGVSQTAAASQAAQPYYNAAAGMTLGASQDVGPLTQEQIGYYQNPFTQAVVDPTLQALQRQQGMQRNEQQARAIKSGAGFGDRAAIERATLAREQDLGTAQAIAPLYKQGYEQATQTAMGQQGVIASDMARRLQGAQQLAGLGAGAQQSGIQGGQALLAAGTVGQQTQQADLTAKYQQFLQQQGYPFQTAQFLANIAMGTGALSGSTTSTTQPAPFFSDKRLKHDAKKIGETNDGLPIYSFKYNGDDRTQIGLMAQDVEKKKPEAVGLAPAADGRMYKTVDYDRATRAKKYAGGGLVGVDYDPSSMGGAVGPMSMGEAFARGGYATGGPSILSSADHRALMAANVDPEAGPYAEHGIYKTPRNVIPGFGGSKINMGKAAPPPSLVTPTPAGGNTANQIGLGAQALSGLQMVNTGKEAFNTGKTALLGSAPTKDDPEGARGLIGGQGKMSGTNIFQSLMGDDKATGGLVVPRSGYALEGAVDEKTEDQGDESGVVIPGMKGGIPLGAGMKTAQLAIAKSPSGGGGGQRGAGNDIMDAFKLGKTAMDFGSTAMEFLPMLFANGGLVPRKGYAGDDGESGAVIDPGLILSPAARKSIIAEGDAAEGGSDTVALAPAKDVVPPAEAKAPERRAPASEDLDTAARNALALQMRRESGGDWNAKSGSSTAGGAFQITNGTAEGIIKRNPQLGIQYRNVPHFASTLEPEQQQALALALSREHAATLAQHGFEATPDNIAANWFLGGSGGPAFLKALQNDPNQPAYKYASEAAVNANPNMFFKNGMPLTLAEVQSKLSMSGSKAPSKGLDIGSYMPTLGRSGPGMYSGKEASQASLGDVVGEFLPKSVPTGSNFWVPALSGIGSMLSSKSPYLLGAVGEGLVGGVSGYQAQKKEERETVKNIFDMVKGRFTQTVDDNMNLVFRDTMTGAMVQPGQVQAAVSNMLTSAGIDPAPYGLGRTQSADASRAGTGAPARQLTDAGTEKKPEAKTAEGAVVEKPKAQEAVAKPVEEWNAGDFRKDVFTNPTRYGFTSGGDNDPNIRLKDIERDRALARKAAMLGIKEESTRFNLQAQEKEKILNEQIKDAYSSDLARVDQQRKDIQANANAYVQDIKKSGDAYMSARQQAIKLSEAFSRAQMGPGSDVKAYVTGLAKTFGFSLPEKFNSDAEAIAYANKLAMKNVVEQAAASNLLRAPKAVLGSMEQINATSKMDPNAAYRLLGDMIGEMDYVHGRNTDYLKNHRGKEPAIHGSQYDAAQGDKGYKTTLAKAYSELAIPQDPNAAKTVRDIYSELSEYGYKPRLEKQKAGPSGGEAKTETPAAPAVPAPLQNMEGLQYSASRNQYRDKAGNVYDASGKRVQ